MPWFLFLLRDTKKKMASPATARPTAVKVPATAGVLWRKPVGVPPEVPDDDGVSRPGVSVFVGLGAKSDATNVVGACKSVGAMLKVVCWEAFGINTTEGVEEEENELLKIEVELVGGAKEVEEVVGVGVGEEVRDEDSWE